MLITTGDKSFCMTGAPHSLTGPDQSDRDRQEFLLVLLMLLPVHVIFPVLPGAALQRSAMILFFSFILLAGVWIMRGSRRRFLLTAILTVVTLELFWISLWPAAASLLILGEFCLVIFLIVLSGRIIQVFIRTTLPLIDLFIAGISLILLEGTFLGILIHLVGVFQPYTGSPDLAGSLWGGIALLTGNASLLLPLSGQVSPLLKVISLFGMIGGLLLLALIIGKIGAQMMKKESTGS
jgi:hypothetical protein